MTSIVYVKFVSQFGIDDSWMNDLVICRSLGIDWYNKDLDFNVRPRLSILTSHGFDFLDICY